MFSKQLQNKAFSEFFAQIPTFGMGIKTRNFVEFKDFRYGFNGKEKTDEISGSGNSYDFGARIYDSRLGRWMSLDPEAKKYPGISPNAFAFDNPVIFNDPDGKDGRLTITNKEEGGGTITLETTVYLYTTDPAKSNLAEMAAIGAQNKFNELDNSYEYIDASGHTWTIEIKVTYKADQSFATIDKAKTPDEVKSEELVGVGTYKAGDNIGCSDCETEPGIAEQAKGLGIVGATKGASVHGLFHLFGAGDSYNLGNAESLEEIKYFSGDVTSAGVPITRIDNFHFQQLGAQVLNPFTGSVKPEFLGANGMYIQTILANPNLQDAKEMDAVQQGRAAEKEYDEFIKNQK